MDFRVGQKVVCIDDAPHPEWPGNGNAPSMLDGLTRGVIYTIVGIVLLEGRCPGNLGVHLKEITRKHGSPYGACRFEALPQREDPIQIFRQMCVAAGNDDVLIPVGDDDVIQEQTDPTSCASVPGLVDDMGVRLKDGSWAVSWHPNDGWQLITPVLPDQDMVPKEALALVTMFVRCDHPTKKDEGFVQDMVDWFNREVN